MLGRSAFSQPGGRLELYQAMEPIVTAATKPTTYTRVKAIGKLPNSINKYTVDQLLSLLVDILPKLGTFQGSGFIAQKDEHSQFPIPNSQFPVIHMGESEVQ
ncbi:MAG: hypothetical protein F6K41_07445 [Symploca sp. SIO3E6]|nr:hypothetical protein [Caldora sp. SIO3E6]